MGTTCHQIQEELLLNPELSADDYVGRVLDFHSAGGESWQDSGLRDPDTLEASVVVTEEMVDAVRIAVAFITERQKLTGGELLVEQRVPIGQFTGEDDAWGSADVILLGSTWIEVMDSKFGRKRVNASRMLRPERIDFITGEHLPELRGPNLQMASYALGSIHSHDVLGTVEDVIMTIVQPFIGHTDSYSCSIGELRETERFLAAKAEETRTNPKFKPTFENCFFCRAKGRCDAQSSLALSSVFDGFGEEDSGPLIPPNPLMLGSQYSLVPFVLQWASDVEEKVRSDLTAGMRVTRNDGVGFKLIEGKAAPREWVDEVEAAKTLKRMRFSNEEMYSFKVISPTAAEKFSKAPRVKKGAEPIPARIGERQWGSLQKLITRGETKPRIALETDPRPSICKATGFEDVNPEQAVVDALFGDC